MKTVRTAISNWLDSQDKSWRILSSDRQRTYTRCFFLAYLLLAAGVLLKIWYDMARAGDGMAIEHIDSPVRKRARSAFPLDTLPKLLKEPIYERK